MCYRTCHATLRGTVTRTASHKTPAGQRWYAKLVRARQTVERAEQRRDQLAREALATGEIGVRGVAEALGIDKSSASRRYRPPAR
jgi:hypothetical protein